MTDARIDELALPETLEEPLAADFIRALEVGNELPTS